MSERKKTKVQVLAISSTELPNKLDEVAAIFQSAWDKTPEEYRSGMAFYVWGVGGHDGGGSCDFEAYYIRDETDAEMSAREQREAAIRDETTRKELATLAALKEKYAPYDWPEFDWPLKGIS